MVNSGIHYEKPKRTNDINGKIYDSIKVPDWITSNFVGDLSEDMKQRLIRISDMIYKTRQALLLTLGGAPLFMDDNQIKAYGAGMMLSFWALLATAVKNTNLTFKNNKASNEQQNTYRSTSRIVESKPKKK